MAKVSTVKIFVEMGDATTHDIKQGSVIQSIPFFTDDVMKTMVNSILSKFPANVLNSDIFWSTGRVYHETQKEFKTEIAPGVEAVITKEGDALVLTMTEGRTYLTYKAIPFQMEEDDVCYGTIATWHDKNSSTFTHEVFDSLEEARAYLEISKAHPYLADVDEYKIEVFSKKRITNMLWYKRAMEQLGIQRSDVEVER